VPPGSSTSVTAAVLRRVPKAVQWGLYVELHGRFRDQQDDQHGIRQVLVSHCNTFRRTGPATL
jgi:hypothetical protein